jgi:hypothetical protein
MADGGVGKGIAAAPSSDNGPNVEQPQVDEQPQVVAQPSVERPPAEQSSSEDELDLQKWMAETKKLKAFARDMSPSPTRGRGNRGPYENEPEDDYPESWNVEK